VEKPEFSCESVAAIEPYYFSDLQQELARFISTYYVSSLGEAYGLFVPFSTKSVKSCEIELKSPTLSQAQQEALAFLERNSPSLLFGDTGSGKTEIYIALMAKRLAEGKRILLLMPEIALTPQMQQRLESYFGQSVVIWHSKLTKKRRQEALEKIYSGEAAVVAGPRSALFLPIANLGLIVVDEEHDDSYKSQSRPRINAKDVALYMGKKFGVEVVLGSATPSLTSYHKIPSFRLKGSFYKGKKEILFDSSSGISSLLIDSVSQVLKEKKQALIFLPTRAHFKYLICEECGKAIKCPYCDVGMSVHFDKRALVCHYCNFSQFIPANCPHCGAEALRADRIGTKEIAQELRTLFPEAKIEQFDRDTITTHNKLIKRLQAFKNKEIDVLVGTQMLAKGHDYPDVALSVVMGLDYILAMADYRARERAMSLFVQVAGRAGRKGEGRVLVQTKNREFFESFGDYEEFLKEELMYRKDHYPPFVRMAQLLFAHKSEAKAKKAMEEVLECLRGHEVTIVGYGKSAIEKIAGKWRYHILIKSPSVKKLLQAIHTCKNGLCEVDVDPVNLA
jgi:primosomal protein N' (replication factor Y)